MIKASTPVCKVGWITGAKRGLWLVGISLSRPASLAFAHRSGSVWRTKRNTEGTYHSAPNDRANQAYMSADGRLKRHRDHPRPANLDNAVDTATVRQLAHLLVPTGRLGVVDHFRGKRTGLVSGPRLRAAHQALLARDQLARYAARPDRNFPETTIRCQFGHESLMVGDGSLWISRVSPRRCRNVQRRPSSICSMQKKVANIMPSSLNIL